MCISRRLASTVTAVAALSLVSPDASAEPTLDVVVSDQAVSVGDRVPVRVVARGGDGWLWGELTVQVRVLGPWEVVDGPRPIAGSRPPAWEVVLAPMDVGVQPLPGLSVTARPSDGEPTAVTPDELPEVTIASVLPPDQEVEPAPLRDPLGVRGFPWEWVGPAVVALSPLLVAAAWWLQRRRTGAVDDPARRLPPIDQLEALLGELMSKVGREPAPGVCDQLASGCRHFLERRSGEPAQEMTSFELRRLARRSRWPEPVQRSLQQVMGVADRVRFARQQVADAELRAAIDAAREAGRELEGFLTAQERAAEGSS